MAMTFTACAVYIDHDTWEARVKWLRDHQIKYSKYWARDNHGNITLDVEYFTFENEDDFIMFTLTWL